MESISELRRRLDLAAASCAQLEQELTGRRKHLGEWKPALDILRNARSGLDRARTILDTWLPSSRPGQAVDR
jgi:hypothetical protein